MLEIFKVRWILIGYNVFIVSQLGKNSSTILLLRVVIVLVIVIILGMNVLLIKIVNILEFLYVNIKCIMTFNYCKLETPTLWRHKFTKLNTKVSITKKRFSFNSFNMMLDASWKRVGKKCSASGHCRQSLITRNVNVMINTDKHSWLWCHDLLQTTQMFDWLHCYRSHRQSRIHSVYATQGWILIGKLSDDAKSSSSFCQGLFLI